MCFGAFVYIAYPEMYIMYCATSKTVNWLRCSSGGFDQLGTCILMVAWKESDTAVKSIRYRIESKFIADDACQKVSEAHSASL
jgi:hypothetical protein